MTKLGNDVLPVRTGNNFLPSTCRTCNTHILYDDLRNMTAWDVRVTIILISLVADDVDQMEQSDEEGEEDELSKAARPSFFF